MNQKPINKVAVIGAGSWGSALALLLARKGMQVCLWGRNAARIEEMRRLGENRHYLPGHFFPPHLMLSAQLADALNGADCVCMVTPSHGYRSIYQQVAPLLGPDALVVSAVKGIEESSLKTMTQVMEAAHEPGTKPCLGVLSGPSFAEEVAGQQPTAITVAFHNQQAAIRVQQLFSTDYFRVYSSCDVIGLEICGAMKNVIAIASGICDGLGYGLNTRAALITRGLAEITRLGVALGAEAQTFAGLAGLGDLVLTCTGSLSRNRSIGLKLGAGQSLPQILAEMSMVAEGVKTTASCFHLAQTAGVEMPILEQMYALLYQGKACKEAVEALLQRDLKYEHPPSLSVKAGHCARH